MRIERQIRTPRLIVCLVAVIVLASCAGDAVLPQTQTSREYAGTAEEVATADTPTAAAVAAAPMQSPLDAPRATSGQEPSSPASTVDENASPGAALPGVITRIRVTEDGQRILDFRRDSVTRRLFVSTTDDMLVALDGDSLQTVQTFPFGGELVIDEADRRLYVGPGSQFVVDGDPIQVYVIDLDTLAIVGQLEGVHYVSVDRVNRRLFGGSPLRAYEEARGSDTIPVYDLDSLELLYEIDQQGIPTYNPYRNELLVTAYTVLVVDAESGEVRADLLPELEMQPFRWCNGCEHASAARILEHQDLLLIERTETSTGGGPGFSPADIYLDAQTLQLIDSFSQRLPFQPSCSTLRIPVPQISDRIVRQEHFVRYMVYRNFEFFDNDGRLETWRDGLFAQYLNPRTEQAYTSQGYVLAIPELVPVGRVPDFCLLDEDAENGVVYGRIEGDLVVIGENSGARVTAVPTEPEPLPEAAVSQILVSPGYPADPTIFLLLEDRRLYRTTDGGQSWLRIQGGLPGGEGLILTVALSPSFDTDRTMLAGGFVGSHQGEGVLISEDAGATWSPVWDGLTHLRVYEIRFSPDYAADGTVQALATYQRLSPWEPGVSLHESTDRGLTWTQVMTASRESDMNAALASATEVARQELPIRIADYGKSLEVRDASGQWQAANLEQKPGETIRALAPSPNHEEDRTYYALGDFSLWRTDDAGQTWSRWRDPRLAGRTYENALTALAATPELPEGGYRLLLGTNAGEFWILTPADTDLEADVAPEQEEESLDAQDAGAAQHAATATPSAQSESDLLSQQPPAGRFRPGGALASVWEASRETREELGWALSDVAQSTPAAYQPFERGAMIWYADADAILVLREDGTWSQYDDTFEEGETEFDPSLEPPGGAQQPIRGFGKLWRTTDDVRDALGWALDEERGYSAFVHEFERGILFSTPAGTLILLRDGDGGGQWR